MLDSELLKTWWRDNCAGKQICTFYFPSFYRDTNVPKNCKDPYARNYIQNKCLISPSQVLKNNKIGILAAMIFSLFLAMLQATIYYSLIVNPIKSEMFHQQNVSVTRFAIEVKINDLMWKHFLARLNSDKELQRKYDIEEGQEYKDYYLKVTKIFTDLLKE